jgi:hypothetical protein
MLRKRVLSGSSSEDPDDPGTPETHDNDNWFELSILCTHIRMNVVVVVQPPLCLRHFPVLYSINLLKIY